MVSKVAVIALVVVVACPILMGYALNFNETTVTDYSKDPDETPLNVTQLLSNGSAYTVASADSYQINSHFAENSQYAWPQFEAFTTTASPLPLKTKTIVKDSTFGMTLENAYTLFFKFDYTYDGTSSISCDVYYNGGQIRNIGNLVQIYYNLNDKIFTYIRMTGPDNYVTGALPFLNTTYESIWFDLVNMASVKADYSLGYITGYNDYVDLSAGFHFTKYAYEPTSFSNGWLIELPDYTFNYLMTINLDSITAPSYATLIMDRFLLQKSIIDGIPSWTITDTGTWQTYNMYYSTSLSDNTYQMYVEYSDQPNPSDDPLYPDPYKKYDRHVEFRYVGDWPDLIGPANQYLKYEFDYSEITLPNDNNLHFLKINDVSSDRTPTLRMDAATFNAFLYDLIEDQYYDPAAFRSNPSTTINNVQKFGGSLEFGGNTYTVDNDGNITLGTHKISVNKMVLSSIPNLSGGYDNMINGYVVSNTISPGTITFNGKWAAQVTTLAMVAETHLSTEWVPGQFSWDGIDDNFLIMGIFSAFAAMIGVGIYAKNRKLAVIPVVIVCGCAALLFFMMI